MAPGLSPWLVYQRSTTDATELAEIEAVMDELGYRSCRTVRLATTTEMVKYYWHSFNCEPPAAEMLSETNTIKYEFFGTAFDRDSKRLFFSDRWSAKIKAPMDKFNMSFQVLSDEWNNVAQLDLPLVIEGELRQYWIDVSDVPTGTYRLMAILYDAQNGEREAWIDNPGYVPEMLELGEIVVD